MLIFCCWQRSQTSPLKGILCIVRNTPCKQRLVFFRGKEPVVKTPAKIVAIKYIKAPWDRVALILLQYLFLDDPADGLKSFHFALLNALRRAKKLNVPAYLNAESNSAMEEVQQGKRTDPLYQGLI